MPVLSVSFMALLVGVFVVYTLFPQRHRWVVLLAASLIFYLAAGVGSLVCMLITSVTVYASACAMRLIVPLGISFYTFQSVGYLADVYGGHCRAQTNYFRLLLFISFFPQITQGPISAYESLSETL